MPKATRRNSTKRIVRAQNYDPKQAETCPAVAIQNKLRGLMEAYSEIEIGFDTESETIKESLRELFDARDAYENLLTFTKAASVEGAMAQLSVLHDRAEFMFNGITSEDDQANLAPVRRTIERLLYSIAGVLRGVVGEMTAARMFDGDFHPMHDPLPKIERGAAGEPIGETIDDCFKKQDCAA